MLRINPQLYLGLFLIFYYFQYGATVDYNPYDNKQQSHLLQTTNAANDGYNAQQAAFNENTAFQQNLQGNSNYPQFYRYYYTPPYQQQQQQQILQPQQSTQLWSGPPIVVEDDIQQQQQHSSTNIPPTFYQQHSTGSSSELLPFLHKNSKVLTATVYNPQPTTRTTQAYFYNHNNNNIIYHRDFRHQINARPETQHTQQEDNMISWNNQQQQHQLLDRQPKQQQKQPPEFYTSDTTNLRYNGISNDLLVASFRKVNVPEYGEHFKRYLENNPRRIKPIY